MRLDYHRFFVIITSLNFLLDFDKLFFSLKFCLKKIGILMENKIIYSFF